MSESAQIEIREHGQKVRYVTLDRALVIGRDCAGENVADEGVSRRHLKFLPSPLGLSVVDLDSRNGTYINGTLADGRVELRTGDVLRVGGTDIVVRAIPGSRLPVRRVPESRATIRTGFAIPRPPPVPLPSPVNVAPRWSVRKALRLVFVGPGPSSNHPAVRNYLELPTRVPQPLWHIAQVIAVVAYLALCVAMFLRPAGAMFAFFGVIVPLLPIVFFVAPGLWRNICPLAASNQAPRLFGFSRAATVPEWLRRRVYVIAAALFFGIVCARLALFDNSAGATGVLLSVVIASAFVGGVVFKGKSGWCSSICPLLPLQRVYGQTPFVTVPNSHCRPCVSCTKNCYDFKPHMAHQADLVDADTAWSAPRRLFVAALPGLVLGYFTLANQIDLSDWALYQRLVLYLLVSVGSFFALDALSNGATVLIAAGYAAVAINVFYWYCSVVLANSFAVVTGVDIPWVRWPIRIAVALLTVVWISRTYWSTRAVPAGDDASAPQKEDRSSDSALRAETATEKAEVRFLPDGPVVSAEAGISLLEAAELHGIPVEAGCRMGVCGADPFAVLEGEECLSSPDEEELDTLRRLGLAENTRMACCARLREGTVTVSTSPGSGSPTRGSRPGNFDRSILSVVVLGNGIAGVTAADFVRRGHPDCEIHVVGREPLPLYNRMGISRLVYGRSAMEGLHLLTDQWYADHDVTAWLNTIAVRIDPDGRRVTLGTGDTLCFDRLILSMGARSAVPAIEGFGMPGSFVLREAGDAMQIRAYAQEHRCRTAVVAGGGLLGLEVAYALNELGMKVTVLDRGNRLMDKQVDGRCSQLVEHHFARAGIRVIHRAEAAVATGKHRVHEVTLVDGRALQCDVLLACVGIEPEVELAREAGIAANRGVLVDDRMQSSVPDIFAAGDVAEHDGRVLGLWPIAAKQGEAAAINALGGDVQLRSEIPATILKGVGLELFSIGRVHRMRGDEVITVDDPFVPSYRRLVISDGTVVGALILGHHPEEIAAVTAAVKCSIAVDEAMMHGLRAGGWGLLAQSSER
ncbi:FAD-dependent oxidoreductase [Rhodococcus sp. NPDC058521]|uniref:FAD-dependent oxidoreductase n=1 Tax=Rhodococcus sp. NPDC058521 TaxID=3346536 RepID=UPI00365CF496